MKVWWDRLGIETFCVLFFLNVHKMDVNEEILENLQDQRFEILQTSLPWSYKPEKTLWIRAWQDREEVGGENKV